MELTSLSNDEVPVQLQRGALDAGLVMDLGGCAAGLARTALSQHTAAVMVCRSSPFWERTHITPAELDGQTLLVPGFAPDALAPLWQALRRAVHTHSWSWSSNFIRYSTARRSRIVYL